MPDRHDGWCVWCPRRLLAVPLIAAAMLSGCSGKLGGGNPSDSAVSPDDAGDGTVVLPDGGKPTESGVPDDGGPLGDSLALDGTPPAPDSAPTCVPEMCNGKDDDCDNAIDEDWPELGKACDGPDADKCASGTFVCLADGSGTTCQDPGPGASEICFNGIDDNCDGTLDEGCTPTYQVVVYGSSMASVAAAAQAIRVLGGPTASQSVVLIDTTGQLGGQSLPVPSQDSRPHDYWVDHLDLTSGSPESCGQYANGVCRGIYGKLSAHWQAQYPTYDVKRYLGRGWAPSASVVRASLQTMVTYVKVVKYAGKHGTLVFNGNRTVAVKMGPAAADLFSGEVIIDGSETGELLGQLSNGDAVQFHVNPGACTQALTWAIPIKRFGASASDVPAGLVATKPSYYATHQAALAQAVVSDTQTNAITWPFNSDLTCKNSLWGLPSMPKMTFADVKRYRWVASPIMSCAPTRGALNIPFNDARDDTPTNDTIEAKEAKRRTYALLYYIQQVLGASNWSIDDDQGFGTLPITDNDPEIPDTIEKHFPPAPYVRESRIHLRGSGATLTHAVMGPTVTQSVATNILNGYYGTDFHQGCGVTPSPGAGWYKVPFANAIPLKTQGFLVALPRMWDVDANVASSVRMHPYEVAGGQAIGAIAGDAAKRDVLPSQASIATVRGILQNDGLDLSLDGP